MNRIVEQYMINLVMNQNLSRHTIKAYSIDLNQFSNYISHLEIQDLNEIDEKIILNYLTRLKYKTKIRTTKRKVVSIKKFFQYLHETEQIANNPLNNIRLKYKPDIIMPKTIAFADIKKIYDQIYLNYENAITNSDYYLTELLFIEILYTTGIRVSELCNIKINDICFDSKTILIKGKGQKERIVFISNTNLQSLLKKHIKNTSSITSEYLLTNQKQGRLSEQSVRLRLKRIVDEAGIKHKITPHMFRHTFATSLLEEEVNILYIKDLLGHSSLTTTQIYLAINKRKQQRVISKKHPRNKLTNTL